MTTSMSMPLYGRIGVVVLLLVVLVGGVCWIFSSGFFGLGVGGWGLLRCFRMRYSSFAVRCWMFSTNVLVSCGLKVYLFSSVFM